MRLRKRALWCALLLLALFTVQTGAAHEDDDPFAVTLPLAVRERIAEIAARGRLLDLNPTAFAKVGDSLTVAEHYLKPFAWDRAVWGDYAALADTADYFDDASFTRASEAAGVGWTSYLVVTAEYADTEVCSPVESPLMCEYRLTQPSIALITLGSNDVSILSERQYAHNMRRIIDLTIGRGIVPILSTIPPRIGREDEVIAFNAIISALADEYDLPLIALYDAMIAIDGFGLDEDGVHPTVPPGLVAGSVDFRADNLYYGHVIRNLTTLHMLDAVRRAMNVER
jgi:hypothetical protein